MMTNEDVRSEVEDLGMKIDALSDQLDDLKRWLEAAFSALDITVIDETQEPKND